MNLAIHLTYFVKVQKFFTHTQLNRRMKQFNYQGSDAKLAPSEISEKGTKVSGQAIEKWTLLRFIPIKKK